MTELTASRTLVKSPPELWAACSDPCVLGRHLEPFGEIRITRLEPETTVAWEGERASGTVRIEPSGWGTRVTLTADTPEPEPAVAPQPPAASPAPPPPPPAEGPAPDPPPLTLARRRRGGVLAWLFGRERSVAPATSAPEAKPAPAPLPEPQAEPLPEPPVAPEPADAIDAEATLAAALDSLGQAHHRPFSRG